MRMNATVQKHLKTFGVILATLLLLWGLAWVRLTAVNDFHRGNGDYSSYIETAQYIAGETNVLEHPNRLIKPLAPLFIALFHQVTTSYETAFFLHVSFFFGLLGMVSYLFFKEFFHESKSLAVIATLLFIGSYPLLDTGISSFTETGALFFYMSSLYGLLLLRKKPSISLILINSLIITTGFFWKEYSGMNLLIGILTLLSHQSLNVQNKLYYLLGLILPFTLIHAGWQIWFFAQYNYTYLDWYINGGLHGAERNISLSSISNTLLLLLAAGWMTIPSGLQYMQRLGRSRILFLLCMTLPLPLAIAWGFVSTRLWAVMLPSLIIISALGIYSLFSKSTTRWMVTALLLASNVALLSFG